MTEKELSERFDEEVLPSVIQQYGVYDQVAINEAFNDWIDMLYKDGEISEYECDNYCYIGRLAK